MGSSSFVANSRRHDIAARRRLKMIPPNAPKGQVIWGYCARGCRRTSDRGWSSGPPPHGTMEGMNPLSRSLSSRPPRDDIDEADLVVHGEAHAAAGAHRGGGGDEAGGGADGAGAHRADAAADEPGRWLRLPGLRLAGPRPSIAQPRSSARTAPRRSPTRRPAPRRPGVLRRALASPTSRADRLLAGRRVASPSRWSRTGATHYEPILVGRGLRADWPSPAGARRPRRGGVLHLGRTSQRGCVPLPAVRARAGTNNLPDCSNMCHESTRRSAGRDHRDRQGLGDPARRRDGELILIAGQNPGTNHPRMLHRARGGQARAARRSSRSTRSARPGCCASRTPRTGEAWSAMARRSPTCYLQVRLGGDLALFHGVAKFLLERRGRRHGLIDHDVHRDHTVGLRRPGAQLARPRWPEIERASGREPRADRASVRRCLLAVRRARSSAGRWASPSTKRRGDH